MQKPNLTKICRTVKASTIKHSPEILTGVGIAGMVTTTVMAVRATPKAIRLLEDEKHRQNTDKLEPIDAVKILHVKGNINEYYSKVYSEKTF